MPQSVSKTTAETRGADDISPQHPGSESQSAAIGPAKDTGADLPETAAVTIAALLHLFRLAGAELVLMRPGYETQRFEQAVHSKIDQFTGPTTSQSARDTGLALARHLVEQVLTQIRAQAEVKRSLTRLNTSADPNHIDAETASCFGRLLLN
jgi:hypothetical protein